MRVDIKQHENDLTIALPRSIAAQKSILNDALSAMMFSSFGLLGCWLLTFGTPFYGIIPFRMLSVFTAFAWCASAPHDVLFLHHKSLHLTRGHT
jgi:hypothetical protein